MTMDYPGDKPELLAPDAVPSRRISLKSRWLALLSQVAHYFEKRSGRIALSELSDEQLQDIGVTRREAGSEIAKSWFWC
jgi:uncharacterized protein YjiS (DUF1127 family)